MRYASAPRTFLFVVLMLVLSPQAPSQTPARRPAPQRPAASRPAPIALGVSAFRQTVGTPETEPLGVGITDSLANALKGLGTLAVAGPEVVAAGSEKESIDGKTDEGAVRIARQLGLMMIIVGSYQQVGNQLIVDARVLNVQTDAALTGSSIAVSAKYPDEYAALLTQLAGRVATALRLPVVAGQAQKLGTAFMSSSSADALRLYNQGLQRMSDGTQRSLEVAIALFTECLTADPAYALAYAARADAQNRLIDASRAIGDDKERLAQAAVNDAQQAVKARPNLARGQAALARAQTAAGNYDHAVQAAERAVALNPNDGAAQIVRSRAKNKGELVESKDIAELMFRQPWMQYMFFYLPKVIVRNHSRLKLTVLFVPAIGDAYPVLTIQPDSSRAMTVFAGKFNVDLDSDAGILKREFEFKGGEQYELTYRAEEIPVTRIVGTNSGNSPAYVTFDGPKKREYIINPGAQEVFNVQSGQYHITCAGAAGGSALEQRDDYLRAGGEYRYACSVRRTLTYRPTK